MKAKDLITLAAVGLLIYVLAKPGVAAQINQRLNSLGTPAVGPVDTSGLPTDVYAGVLQPTGDTGMGWIQ